MAGFQKGLALIFFVSCITWDTETVYNNFDSIEIFLTSSHMRYHMKAHEISRFLVKTVVKIG